MSRRGESIYKRKDGRWEARYIHHYENGIAKYRFIYAHSYAEVKAKRVMEQAQPEQVVASHVKSIAKFKEISLLWLTDIKPMVKESTYTRYHRIVTHYMYPAFVDHPLVTLDFLRIKAFMSDLLTSGGKGQKPLSPKTVCDILCVLKSIFKYGKANGYPCADLEQLKLPNASPRACAIITECGKAKIERSILLSEITDRDRRVKLGILLTLYTGVRIGELCGLKHADIDLENKIVTISRTVERIADLDVTTKTKTKIVISEPKTATSHRIIPIPAFLVQYLQSFEANPDCYLLTGTAKYTEPHQYYQRYKTFMKKLGLDQYSFHSLRHTFATHCIDNGFDPKSLSEILGHADVSTTLSLYVHPTLEQKRRQMELLQPKFHS